jgi:hypothetical protein
VTSIDDTPAKQIRWRSSTPSRQLPDLAYQRGETERDRNKIQRDKDFGLFDKDYL